MVVINVRKLMAFGKGSFIMSMPKKWIEKNNLKKGDLISLSEEGSELILSASPGNKKKEPKEMSIDAKEKTLDSLKVEIVSAYLNGYDVITIFIDSSFDVRKIKEIIRNLSGLEIMEQTSTRLVARNLINFDEIDIANIIRRMDIIARAMMEDSILCAKGQSTYDSINHRDEDVNRLFYLGCRVTKNAMKNPGVAKNFGIDEWQLHSETLMLQRLEKIADNQKRLSRHLCRLSLQKNLLSDLIKIHSEITDAYKEVMKGYYNKDSKTAGNVESTNRALTNSCDLLLQKYSKSFSGAKDSYSGFMDFAKVIENLKATSVDIRNIARTVLCFE